MTQNKRYAGNHIMHQNLTKHTSGHLSSNTDIHVTFVNNTDDISHLRVKPRNNTRKICRAGTITYKVQDINGTYCRSAYIAPTEIIHAAKGHNWTQ